MKLISASVLALSDWSKLDVDKLGTVISQLHGTDEYVIAMVESCEELLCYSEGITGSGGIFITA